MRATALSRKVRKYVPDEFKDMTTPPVFSIKSISKRKTLEIYANLNIAVPDADAEGNIQLGSWDDALKNYDVQLEVLKIGLMGWTNYNDEDGVPVEFEPSEFETIEDELMADLVREISGNVKEEDAKNSEGESSSTSGSETTKTPTNGPVDSVEVKGSEKSETVTESSTH